MNVLLGSESGVGDGNVFRIADKVKNDIWLVLARENHSDHLCVCGGGGGKGHGKGVGCYSSMAGRILFPCITSLLKYNVNPPKKVRAERILSVPMYYFLALPFVFLPNVLSKSHEHVD